MSAATIKARGQEIRSSFRARAAFELMALNYGSAFRSCDGGRVVEVILRGG